VEDRGPRRDLGQWRQDGPALFALVTIRVRRPLDPQRDLVTRPRELATSISAAYD
jgi:hypothetical protein